MKMKAILVSTLATVLPLVSLAATAGATDQTRSFPAINCLAPNGGLTSPSQVQSTYGQMGNWSASSTLELWCPIMNEDGFQTVASHGPFVNGYANGATGGKFSLCRTYNAGNGGACNATVDMQSNAGVFHTWISQYSQWAFGQPNDGYYVDVILPGTYLGGVSSIWSFNMTSSQ